MLINRKQLMGCVLLLLTPFASAQSKNVTQQDLLQSVATYEKAGQGHLALEMLREWRTSRKDVSPSVDFQLLYAKLLLQQQQEVEALGVLRTLKNQNLTAEQQRLYYELQLDYSVYRALRSLSLNDISAAQEAIAPVISQRPNDPQVLYASGKVALAQGNSSEAYKQLKKAIDQGGGVKSPDWYLDFAKAATEQGKKSEARSAIQQALALKPEDIGVLTMAQVSYETLGDHKQAAQFKRQIRLLESAQLPVLPAASESKVVAVDTSASTKPTETLLPPSRLQEEYDAIMSERSASVELGFYTAQRKGDAGLSRLSRFEQPIEISVPLADNKAVLQITPVQLSAGRVKGDLYSISAFGGGPSAAEKQINELVGSPGRQHQKGVGFAIKYVADGVEADIGVTPVGFEQRNLVGGVKLSGTLDNANTVGYKLNVSRRPVTESLLSFAGTKDERTGQSWGGVTATGVRGDISKDFGSYGLYAAAAWHTLRGKNVENNQRREFNVGTYTYLFEDLDELLMLGANLNATFYDKNQRHFTYGHGGYFSPQYAYGLALPLSWAVRDERLSYVVNASVGVTRFKEDPAAIHPHNSQMQAEAVKALAANPQLGLGGLTGGYYPGQKKTVFNYGLNAALEYRMTPQAYLGAQAALENANDYRQWAAGLFLRYYFYPQKNKLHLPVTPYNTPYSQGIAYGQ